MPNSRNPSSEDQTVQGYRAECQAIAQSERCSFARNLEPGGDIPHGFPQWIISGIAAEFADLYTACLEPPKEFFYMSFLTCLGSILSPLLTLNSEITPEPRLFTILLGESADDRKSTAISKTCDFFSGYFPDYFTVCWGVGSAEGLQKRLQRKENGSLLLCFDEFKQFVNKCRVEASVLLPCVNTLFESNRYESQTKKASIEIADAHLSMLAASTVQTYQNIWLPAFTDIGFNNRLFLVPGSAERRYAFPRTIAERDKRPIHVKLRRMLRQSGSGKRLRIEEAARRAYEEWYLRSERSFLSKRLDVYALSMMSLIAVCDGKRAIDQETVSKVIALCDWQLGVRRLYDPVDAENAVARLEERIRRQLTAKGPLTERELRQKTNASRSGLWAFSSALNNLHRAEEIFLSGRREKRWAIKA